MSPREIVLYPTDCPCVAFHGRVIARAEGSDEDGLAGRSFCLTVYESDGGSLHLGIEFRTSCEHESPCCIVECDIDKDDIDEVLLVYDATAHLCDRHLPARSPEEAARFRKKVYGQYDDLCGKIGAQLRQYQPTATANVKKGSGETTDASSGGWRRWISTSRPR